MFKIIVKIVETDKLLVAKKYVQESGLVPYWKKIHTQYKYRIFKRIKFRLKIAQFGLTQPRIFLGRWVKPNFAIFRRNLSKFDAFKNMTFIFSIGPPIKVLPKNGIIEKIFFDRKI